MDPYRKDPRNKGKRHQAWLKKKYIYFSFRSVWRHQDDVCLTSALVRAPNKHETPSVLNISQWRSGWTPRSLGLNRLRSRVCYINLNVDFSANLAFLACCLESDDLTTSMDRGVRTSLGLPCTHYVIIYTAKLFGYIDTDRKATDPSWRHARMTSW